MIYSIRYVHKSYWSFPFSSLHPDSSLSSPYQFYHSIYLPFFTVPVVKPISTLHASSNNDPDMNQRVIYNMLYYLYFKMSG